MEFQSNLVNQWPAKSINSSVKNLGVQHNQILLNDTDQGGTLHGFDRGLTADRVALSDDSKHEIEESRHVNNDAISERDTGACQWMHQRRDDSGDSDIMIHVRRKVIQGLEATRKARMWLP